MATPSALFAAVDLAKTPILVGMMRHRPLPPDVLTLIQIAAGSPDKLQESAETLGRDAGFVRAAATFYIRQVLWAGDADHYRVLGVEPNASPAKIAEHLRWYMKWLHPDTGAEDVQTSLGGRVLKAWDAVKTPERRRQYDQLLSKGGRQRGASDKAGRSSRRRIPWIWQSVADGEKAWSGRQWGFVAAAVAVVALIASLTWSSDALQQAMFSKPTGEAQHQVHFEFAGPAQPLAK